MRPNPAMARAPVVTRLKRTSTPAGSLILQRKCACGGSAGATSDCVKCEEKRLSLQRKGKDQGGFAVAPPVVYKVLSSAGQTLAPEVRSLMEDRFGHDFSRVRVHIDNEAQESARAVNAVAYTVGNHVVFGKGRFAPDTSDGRRLLAHELTHVSQQGPSARWEPEAPLDIAPSSDVYEAEAEHAAQNFTQGRVCAGRHAVARNQLQRACGEAEVGRVSGCVGQSGDITGDSFLFVVGCDTLRTDTSPTEEERLRLYVARVSPGETIEIHGFASEEGTASFNEELSCARAVRARSILIAELAGAGLSASVRLFKHGATAGRRRNRRSVVIRSMLPAEPAAPRGRVTCHCPEPTHRPYRRETIEFIRSIRATIQLASGGTDSLAVAGAIADEFDTRQGIRVVVDGLQDAVLDSLSESEIDTDRFFDINSRLLNAMRNDVGPANINVQTALELVQSRELSVPGSPVTDIQVHRIIDFLLTERGTVEAAVAVIRQARTGFAPFLGEHDHELALSILVEYFKQGNRYHVRFLQGLRANPEHRICPGEGGCRFLFNAEALQRALLP